MNLSYASNLINASITLQISKPLSWEVIMVRPACCMISVSMNIIAFIDNLGIEPIILPATAPLTPSNIPPAIVSVIP